MQIYSVLTKNCNVACEHCYISAGPGNKKNTMSSKNFKKIVNNLKGKKNNWTLTGGEIFTVRKNLWEYLKILKTGTNLEKDTILIQTNGFWLEKEEYARRIAKVLKNFNVNYIEIASDDKFHRTQGIKIPERQSIISILGIEGINYHQRGAEEIMPIGRGEKFNEYYDCQEFCKYFLKHDLLLMDWNGDVSSCCFGLFKLGNLIEDPPEKILEKYKKNKFIQKLEDGGISNVATFYGMNKNEISRRIIQSGTGGLCAYLNREGFIPEEYRRIFKTK